MVCKKIKREFENLKLSKKMLLIYLLLLLITFLIAIAALQVSFNIYDKQLYEKSQQELDFFSQRVNNSLEELEQVSMAIATDPMIQEHLAKMKAAPYISAEYYYELQELRGMLQQEIFSYPDIKNVIYTDSNQVSITVGMALGNVEESKMKQMLGKLHEADGSCVFFDPTEEYPFFLSGRDILQVENATLDYMGSLIFTSDIAGIIKSETKTLQAEHSDLYIYNEKNMIYQETPINDIELPRMNKNRGYRIINHNNTKSFLCYEKSEKTGWMYVNIFPYSEIFGQTWIVRAIMFGCFGVLFLLSVFVLRFLSRFVTRPLEQFNESMQIVERGDFQAAKLVLMEEGRKDEVGVLTREFKVMLDKIDTLIYENYEKQILLKDTKYKMLQAQINPHFLYNTLNALNWMVRGGKNADASKMIIELGKLLRAAFAKEPYTTLKEEMKAVESYMTIQKFRYQDRVIFDTFLDEQVGNYMVPRMIFQPLVENSIHYGVENSITACKICVRAVEEEEWIKLSVEDSGQGMKEKELEGVRNGTIEAKGHGIGLKNIRERLKMTYEKCEFCIESELGKGTKIELKIPKIKISGQEGGKIDV